MFFWHTKSEIEKYHKDAQMTCQNGIAVKIFMRAFDGILNLTRVKNYFCITIPDQIRIAVNTVECVYNQAMYHKPLRRIRFSGLSTSYVGKAKLYLTTNL